VDEKTPGGGRCRRGGIAVASELVPSLVPNDAGGVADEVRSNVNGWLGGRYGEVYRTLDGTLQGEEMRTGLVGPPVKVVRWMLS